MKGLCRRDIDSICEWRDDKTRSVTQVLIAILTDGISDLERVITDVWIPIDLELRLPLELVHFCHAFIDKLLNNITRVGVHSDQTHDFLTHARGQLTLHHLNQFCQKLYLIVEARLQRTGLQGRLYVLYPTDEIDKERDLRWIVLEPVFLRFLLEALERVRRNLLN